MHFDSFHEAFLGNLGQIYTAPEFTNSPRGFASRERLNVNFTLTDPVERVCYLPSRRTNIVFNFAESLWYLSGDDSLAFIAYYAKGIAKYSMDGERLAGTAYGPRIFSFGPDGIDQWDRVAQLLSVEDPASKRAVLQIFRAEEGLTSKNIDVACTLAFQLFVRQDKLHAVCTMRANDAYRGIVSDVFSFTLMQELMARQLGLEVGLYHHNAGSMHSYDADNRRIRRVLREMGEVGSTPLPFQFPRMPPGDNWVWLRKILEYERKLRLGQIKLTTEDVERSDLPPYWQQVLMLLGFYRRNVIERENTTPGFFDKLWPVYQHLLRHRWPRLLKPRSARTARHARGLIEPATK